MEQMNPSLHPEFQGDPAEPHDAHGSEKQGKQEKKLYHTKKKSDKGKKSQISLHTMYTSHQVK